MKVQSFFPWAGGKRLLLWQLIQHFPSKIDRYWEPFVGGGSVFFGVNGRITGDARLSDWNEDIVITYQCVRDRLDDVVLNLQEHKMRDCREHYMKTRNERPADDAARAARFIYMMKRCYRGLFRMDAEGNFKTSYMDGGRSSILVMGELSAAHHALQKAEIKRMDFSECNPGAGDLVYCDPPYDMVHSDYMPDGFDRDDHQRLFESACRWRDAGANVFISQGQTDFIRDLYCREFEVRDIHSVQQIHQAGADRQKTELIIGNNLCRLLL